MHRAITFLTLAAVIATIAPSTASAQRFDSQRRQPKKSKGAQPYASARVSQDTIEIGRNFQYSADVTVRGSTKIDLVRSPDFGNFQVVGQSRFPQIITVNGVTERRLSVRYTLRSSQTGDFEIAPPVFRVGDDQIRPQSVAVKVVERGASPTPKVTNRGRFFIEPTLEPDRNPYVGEQVTLRYDLYVDGAQLDVSPRASREPSLDAFWIEELTERVPKQDQMVSVNGRLMKRMPMWTYALFPLEAGPVTIESSEVELVVGAFFRRGRPVRVASEPIELEVQPLPPDAPDSFAEGNVGNYDFNVKTNQSRTRVGRAFVLELTVSGSGQVGRVELPELPDLPNVRVSDVDEESKSTVRSLDVGGRKTVSYTLTPTAEGEIRIPALEFSYFDPGSARYITHESDPLTVAVATGAAPEDVVAAGDVATRDQAADEDLVSALKKQLQGLRDSPDGRASADPANFPLFYWLLIVGSLLVFVWQLVGARVRRWWASRPSRHAPEEASQVAYDALEAVDDDPAALVRVIRTMLAEGFDIPPGLVTAGDLGDAFAERGLDPEVADELADVLAACEQARFSPGSTLPDGTATRARRAIEKLAETSSANTGAAATALLVAGLAATLAFGLGTTATAHAEQAPETDWGEQQETWEEFVEENPRSVDGLYNLGTSAAMASDYATARWALQTAAYYSAWSSEVGDNLGVVERIVRLQAIERSRTGRTLDGDEVIFWWTLATRTNPHVAAIVTALLWLLCAGMLLARRRSDETAVRDALFVGLVLGLILAVSATFATGARDRLLRTTVPVVVTAESAELREGPNEAAALKRTPPAMVPGVLLRVTDDRGEWVKLVWAGGTGWARRGAVRQVGPGHEVD